MAHALKLHNADIIKYTLIGSTPSDSASTQKQINKLLEVEREKDEERFCAVCPEAFEVLENFCCMHLGINLTKAFLGGVKSATCGFH